MSNIKVNMKISKELAPYFDCVFISGMSICEGCASSVKFEFSHEEMTDEWWLDEAACMKTAGWVVPESLTPYCGSCAEKLEIKHNPNAYSAASNDN